MTPPSQCHTPLVCLPEDAVCVFLVFLVDRFLLTEEALLELAGFDDSTCGFFVEALLPAAGTSMVGGGTAVPLLALLSEAPGGGVALVALDGRTLNMKRPTPPPMRRITTTTMMMMIKPGLDACSVVAVR